MNLHTIDTGFFKLDGGAMFGVVPKTLWKGLNPPDEKNLCTWAMRCLLIESGNRLMLVDTGIGNKQGNKFRSHFEPHGDASLKGSLAAAGFSPEDITDVLLTHLHFDHCGGAVDRINGDRLVTAFPNAVYWSSEKHWNWAVDPNPRERASFLKENILPIREAGQLKFTEHDDLDLEGVAVEYVYGHTEAMMTVHIDDYKGRPLSYAADLVPSSHHVRMPYIMAYDVRPLHTLDEKAALLEKVAERNGILMFEHDPVVECCTLKRTDRGIAVDRTLSLNEL